MYAIAKDVYRIASDNLENIAWGEKPRRRDIVITGISHEQVRELEQKFVKVVQKEFAAPRHVIVNPPASIRDGDVSMDKQVEGDEGEEEEEEEEGADGNEDEEEDEGEYDYEENRALDGGSDPEDGDAVRDNQRRVPMFDFFHSTACSTCEACGAGEGYHRPDFFRGSFATRPDMIRASDDEE